MPSASWISFVSGVRITVYVLLGESAMVTVIEKEASADTGVKPQLLLPIPVTRGSSVAGLLSVMTMSVALKLKPVQ